MSLTQDKYVPIIRLMLSELSYVRERLSQHKHAEWKGIAAASRVPFRTIKRIAYRETQYPRSDTVGKLALYFRTKEKRAQKAA